jgi:poly-gamma-glutamate synthesis protein (capsule biosynthesis protein)
MGPDGLAQMLEGYRGLIRDDDLATVNLETPLVDDVVPLQTGWPPVLGAPVGVAHELARAGVDVVSVATNHAYDQGHVGLARTLALLDQAGIAHAGAATTFDAAPGPALIERDGVRVAVLSFTATMNQTSPRRGGATVHVARLWHEERAREAVAAARANADVVVAAFHWSRDFEPAVMPGQRRLARRLVDAGADVILGTGPHTLQQVERLESPRGDAVVAYSLGNLLSSMAFRYQPGQAPPSGYVHPSNVSPAARDGVVLRIPLELDGARIRVGPLQGAPLWTTNTCLAGGRGGAPIEIRVLPLSRAPTEVDRERRPLIGAALGDEVELLP